MSCGCVRPLAGLQTTTAGAINGRPEKKATSVKVTARYPFARCPGFCAPPYSPARDRLRECALVSHSRPPGSGLLFDAGRHFDAGRRSDRSTRRPQELIRVRWFTLPKHRRKPEPLHVRAASKWSGSPRSSDRSLISSPCFPSPSVNVCSIMFDTSITQTHPAQPGSGNSPQSLMMSPGRLATSTRFTAVATAHSPGKEAEE